MGQTAATGGPDDASERVREATELLTQAVDRMRDARDLLDEAAQVEFLPEGLAGWFQAYEGVVESLRRNLDAALKWNDDKAKLLFSFTAQSRAATAGLGAGPGSAYSSASQRFASSSGRRTRPPSASTRRSGCAGSAATAASSSEEGGPGAALLEGPS